MILCTEDDRRELSWYGKEAIKLMRGPGTVSEDVARLHSMFPALFHKFPQLAKEYRTALEELPLSIVGDEERNRMTPHVPIGDVEPRQNPICAGVPPFEDGDIDPLAVDYVVGAVPKPLSEKRAEYDRILGFYSPPGQCAGRGPNPGEVIL